ncbi:hypothetical protein [Streptomyces sp. NPDC001889]
MNPRPVAAVGRVAGQAARFLLRRSNTLRTRDDVHHGTGCVRGLSGPARPVCDAPACRTCPIDDLLDLLGPLGLRGVVRSAVELYGTCGDPAGILSTTQIDQLCSVAEHLDRHDG